MKYNDFEKRLETLRDDLYYSTTMLEQKLQLVKEITSNLDQLHDEYVKDFAPVAASSFGVRFQHDSDMNSAYIDFSEGYDKFIKDLKKDIVRLYYLRDSSYQILSEILVLPSPHSQILFLRYYLNERPKVISAFFYKSKSTFYRDIKKSKELLYTNLENKRPNWDSEYIAK
ncbi:MAG: hypothetical protein MJ153_05020 [Clostridia bacterium]|nr:hypothetical protein [Clostridia bacterium]